MHSHQHGAHSNPSNHPHIAPVAGAGGHDDVAPIVGVASSAVTGTAGNDRIVAAANDTMTGGGGMDEFVIGANSGSSVITDFGVSGANASIIDLKQSGVASTTFTDLMTHVTEVSGNAVIDLGNGNTLTLDGVDMTTLTAANFELPGGGNQGGHGHGGRGGEGGHGGEHHGHGGGMGDGHDHGGPFGLGGLFGNGPAVITGTSVAGGGDTLTATAANTIIIAGAGNDTLVAAAGNDVLKAGAGNDNLTGAAGNDLFIAGSGNATMTGGSGNNLFSFSGEHGNTLGNAEITNFVSGNDHIRLDDLSSIHGFADLAAIMTQVGANTVIAVDATHNITLDNVTMSALSAADFAFG